MLKDFKEFALKGNVLDMAVGIILGAAFGTVVSSLVKDVLMPPIGLLMGKVDFSNLFVVIRDGAASGPFPTLEAAQKAGAVTVNFGLFANTVISFLIVAWAVFILVKGVNHLRHKMDLVPEAATRDCPLCLSKVPRKATRCAHCTAEITPVPGVP